MTGWTKSAVIIRSVGCSIFEAIKSQICEPLSVRSIPFIHTKFTTVNGPETAQMRQIPYILYIYILYIYYYITNLFVLFGPNFGVFHLLSIIKPPPPWLSGNSHCATGTRWRNARLRLMATVSQEIRAIQMNPPNLWFFFRMRKHLDILWYLPYPWDLLWVPVYLQLKETQSSSHPCDLRLVRGTYTLTILWSTSQVVVYVNLIKKLVKH